ncbi:MULTISPECIES: alpha/beta hydrolase [unclassified Mycobacterium]|uniref:alpha/beta hydrolase n=1 Tax=unclassified Mycobacterium TaxID=2642494 RepID=UPI0007FCAFD7|nr:MULTISPECIES: alpha/beta hydrolase [unclassified Mycobacterium]OBG48657.1 alpha/beta hydrolase [Mycobacterium sp. E735]OBG62774.1 alpha/beta hydrolase [Mycobacterium sp. E188]OBG74031.1 alpha/beta hydrolase [Mycobacterium sp. E3305]OBG79839.1 alpha/beta hydrolase [Mycobacterium sp. E3298]OBH42035.1 alpha/beta hydrolase [Mycobacterium sp. E183]
MTAPDGVDRLHPELRALAITRTDFSFRSIELTRDPFNERRRAAAEQTDARGVQVGEETVPADPPVRVRIYRGGSSPAPVVVYCHAGGFALGNLDTDHRQCVELARRGRCTVVSVDYRLAPEHPYPAALADAGAVLRWVVTDAGKLGLDPTRIAVAGSSAGATLAACLAQAAADGSVPPVVFQLLHQPVLDDRVTPSKKEFRASPAFDGEAADLMWGHYLGATTVPESAVPARRTRLDDLPPALITCAEIDPFRDEAVDYALRLLRAGVSAELHVFARTCHGFDSLLPDSPTSARLFALQEHALGSALHETGAGPSPLL